MPKCMGGITWPKHAHALYQLNLLVTPVLFIVYAKAAFAWMKKKPKKCLLEMRILRQTELQN